MALRKETTTPQGFIAPDAYHRVEDVKIIGKNQIGFSVRSYKDASTAAAFEETNHLCAYDIVGDNPIKQAYGHIKGLDAFFGAEDV